MPHGFHNFQKKGGAVRPLTEMPAGVVINLKNIGQCNWDGSERKLELKMTREEGKMQTWVVPNLNKMRSV